MYKRMRLVLGSRVSLMIVHFKCPLLKLWCHVEVFLASDLFSLSNIDKNFVNCRLWLVIRNYQHKIGNC